MCGICFGGFLHVVVEMALQSKGLNERESEAGSKMETGPCSSCLAIEAPTSWGSLKLKVNSKFHIEF